MIGRFDQHIEVARAIHIALGQRERVEQSGDRRLANRLGDGKVEPDAVRVAAGAECAATSVEVRLLRFVQPPRFPEHVGRGERCMAAEIDFDFGREPAQREDAVLGR